MSGGLSKTALAEHHLDLALSLSDHDYILSLLEKKKTSSGEQLPVKSKRGRKPGAATVEERCIWKMPSGDLCKNSKAEGQSYCKIHLGKVHLIEHQ
jgi:hypothetical protein